MMLARSLSYRIGSLQYPRAFASPSGPIDTVVTDEELVLYVTFPRMRLQLSCLTPHRITCLINIRLRSLSQWKSVRPSLCLTLTATTEAGMHLRAWILLQCLGPLFRVCERMDVATPVRIVIDVGNAASKALALPHLSLRKMITLQRHLRKQM
jgi:hypothetical protein